MTVSVLSTVVVGRSAVYGIAGVECVSPCAARAGAHGDVTSRSAGRGRSALLAGARILASEVDACFTVGTFAVREALSPLAADQRVADVTGGTCAHGPLLSRVVVPRCANSVRPAWIRLAQVSRFE